MPSLWDDLAFLLNQIRWHEPAVAAQATRVLAGSVPPAFLHAAHDASMPQRSPIELATALRVRAACLSGQSWEVPATVAMLREAAAVIDVLTGFPSTPVVKKTEVPG